MSEQPEVALQRLVSALEQHLNACASKREGNDEALNRSYENLEDAFLNYEESLQEAYGEYLPFELAED